MELWLKVLIALSGIQILLAYLLYSEMAYIRQLKEVEVDVLTKCATGKADEIE